ncbi:Pentapeptide repeat-containing protein [bacterium A37T11]|nr:Pentapeptide repeat-containing protein [bacterium A37T11]
MEYFEDRIFRPSDLSNTGLPRGEYDHCQFLGIGSGLEQLSGLRFAGCTFTDCNLTAANVVKTAFQDVSFEGCKMLGIRFDQCDAMLLELSFKNCQLNMSHFYKLKLKNTSFIQCNLSETDFTEADLTGSIFDGTDLNRAHFERSVLEKADFRTAFNYAIDPENNRIRKAHFSLEGLPGLLGKYGISVS